RVESCTIEIRSQLVDVAPYLGIVRRTASVKDADNLPRTFADPHGVANISLGEAAMNRFANDDLVLSGIEPAPGNQLGIGTHGDTGRGHETNGDIGFAGAVIARQDDD